MNEKSNVKGVRTPYSNRNPDKSEWNSETNTKIPLYCSWCRTKNNEKNKFCENCGKQFVESNTNETNYTPVHQSKLASSGLEWKTILKGALIIVGFSFLLGFLIGFFIFGMSLYTFLALVAIANIIALFTGGLYAGHSAKSDGGTHGALAGIVSVMISVPINLLVGFPISIFAIFTGTIWAMIVSAFGGFVGSKIKKHTKLKQMPLTQPNYGYNEEEFLTC